MKKRSTRRRRRNIRKTFRSKRVVRRTRRNSGDGSSDAEFTDELVRRFPGILGKIKPGWNVGKRFDVRVLVMRNLFTLGNTVANTTVQIKDKEEAPPFDKRVEMGTLRITYAPHIRQLDKGDVTGVAYVPWRGAQEPVTKVLKAK